MTMPQQPTPQVDPERMVRLTAEAGALGYAELAANLGRALAVNEAQAALLAQLKKERAAESAEMGQLRQANAELQARIAHLEQPGDDGEAEGSPQ